MEVHVYDETLSSGGAGWPLPEPMLGSFSCPPKFRDHLHPSDVISCVKIPITEEHNLGHNPMASTRLNLDSSTLFLLKAGLKRMRVFFVPVHRCAGPTHTMALGDLVMALQASTHWSKDWPHTQHPAASSSGQESRPGVGLSLQNCIRACPSVFPTLLTGLGQGTAASLCTRLCSLAQSPYQ